MRVIAFIHDEDVIQKVLTHLNLQDVKRKPPPRAHARPINVYPIYEACLCVAHSQMSSVDIYLTDPDYPA